MLKNKEMDGNKKPSFIITKEPIENIIKFFKNDNKLLIVDSYNEDLLKKFDGILIKNNKKETADNIIKKYNSKSLDNLTIYGIGGCTSLDIARAVAAELQIKNKSLIVIPTILSTSCIGVDLSILKDYDGKNKAFRTVAPSKCIISTTTLMETNRNDNIKWTSSGYGDLFGNISAALDFISNANLLSENSNLIDTIKQITPWVTPVLELLDIIKNKSSNEIYSMENLILLAKYIFEMSLEINKNHRQTGGEHKLYYTMEKMYNYPTEKPTHGQIVSIGTLLTVKIASYITRDPHFYLTLREIYEKLNLPLDYSALEEISISREQLINAIDEMRKNNENTSLFEKYATIKMVDEIFGEKVKPVNKNNGISRALEEIKKRHKCSYDELAQKIITKLREYWESNGRPKFIIGLSGGIDSTVVTYLAVKAVGAENVVALTMPAWEDNESISFSKKVRKELGLKEYTLELSGVVKAYKEIIDEVNRLMSEEEKQTLKIDEIDSGNFASRARVAILYFFARKLNGRVLGTSNRTEFVQGYAAKWGTPMSFDFGVLDDLYKTDIQELAAVLGVPEEIIKRAPSTGYYPNQTHEVELDATLKEQDAAAYLLFEKGLTIEQIVQEYGLRKEFLEKILKRYNESEHKRMLRQPHIELIKTGGEK